MRRLAVVLLSLLAGCSNCPETCSYYTREFSPAHIERWVESHCISYGKNGCDISVPIIHEDFIPDRWYITWKDRYGSTHQERVTKELYDAPPGEVQHRHLRWGSTCK